ncbi:MAG: sigma-E processing peptidase SpoIIGA [Oscillospiraceae bacterium]|nr:sigma-E processing peptidase SpoIIGA [Oscillospiraceae bacterium]
MRVYADVVMGLNFLVDLLLLMGTDRLAGYPAAVGRWALGASIGAAYSGLCLMPGFWFLAEPLWRAVFLALMALTAFGWNASALRRGAVFVLLSMALGGLAVGFGGMDMTALILAAAGLWGLCRFGVGTVGEQTCVPVILRRDGRELKVLALRDTGNTLRDPITGESVLVAGADVAKELLGLTEHQLAHPVETLAGGTVPGLRLIPFCSVGRSGGMMLALRMKDTTVGKRRGDMIVAFAQEDIGRGEMYRMLTGGAI